jgi:hypothetical protein
MVFTDLLMKYFFLIGQLKKHIQKCHSGEQIKEQHRLLFQRFALTKD